MAEHSSELAPIRPAAVGEFNVGHPSPSKTKLRLERPSAKEIANHGLVVGVDIPLETLLVPLGWGEDEVIAL